MLLLLPGEGSLVFEVYTDVPNWFTDGNGYKFGPFSALDLDVLVFKNPDRSLSVFISGLLNQTVAFHGSLSDVSQSNSIHFVVTWKYPIIALYIQGKLEKEFVVTSIEQATLPIRISSPGERPPMEVVVDVLDKLSKVFNTISGFLDSSTPELCSITVENSLDRSKFSIASSQTGSWKAILNGTSHVFGFVKQRFGDFLAVCSGYGDRLALAHISQKEAESEITMQKANQEKLNTIARATEIATEISNMLSTTRTDMSEEDKQILLETYFISPMKQLAETAVQNQLRIDFSPPEDDNAA